ncbi:hypothetical protein [Burkholderia pseudomallei]|uniref:hypothetical protein n=1 Tax=Burkholderia pseudomallei TaxID=28450 RepID=UPI0009B1E5CC|nr:hypothetical protein [Burkholderia pseudomallei]
MPADGAAARGRRRVDCGSAQGARSAIREVGDGRANCSARGPWHARTSGTSQSGDGDRACRPSCWTPTRGRKARFGFGFGLIGKVNARGPGSFHRGQPQRRPAAAKTTDTRGRQITSRYNRHIAPPPGRPSCALPRRGADFSHEPTAEAAISP